MAEMNTEAKTPQEAKVLAVGAGGIGCELLKVLVQSRFGHIEVIDLDDIEMSNLNRQFLFRKYHVGQSKSKVAAESVKKFNPNATIVAHHDNIKSSAYDVKFFSQFDAVLNGLDNLEARFHVNRLCLASGVPLVESGTEGLKGQVSVHVNGKTLCYECEPKPRPKTYPICTIRNTPDKAIHCIVWAKDLLFEQLFGQAEVTDLAEGESNTGGETAAEDYKMKQDEDPDHFARRIFNRVFNDDVKRIASMDDLWRERAPPRPLSLDELEVGKSVTTPNDTSKGEQSAVSALGVSGIHSVWNIEESAKVFLYTTQVLGKRQGVQFFDKDDAIAVEFVASASNLRSSNYGIPRQSVFDAKGMAGNIVHAVATTNAIVAGLMALEADKLIRKDFDNLRVTYLDPAPRNAEAGKRNRAQKLIKSGSPPGPNPQCYACGKATLTLFASVDEVTLGEFIDQCVRKRLGVGSPILSVGGIQVYEEGEDLDEDEAENFRANRGRVLASLPGGGVCSGSTIKVQDFVQEFSCDILVQDDKGVDKDEHPDGMKLGGTDQLTERKTGTKRKREEDGEDGAENDDAVEEEEELESEGEATKKARVEKSEDLIEIE